MSRTRLTGEQLTWWRGVLGWILSLGGFAGLAAAAGNCVWLKMCVPAYDAHAYWTAGDNFLRGFPLYALNGPIDFGGFRYPPVFALLWSPFSLLPESVFAAAWTLLAVLALRVLAGSWKRVGWCLWFPPVLIEITQANVILLTGAVVFWTLRHRHDRTAMTLPSLALLKVGPVFCLPYLWILRPATRQALAIGAALLIGACVTTVLFAPNAWPDYFTYLTGQADIASSLSPLMLPTSPLADFVLRFALAAVLMMVAIRWRSDALIFLAAICAVPVLWPASLAPLVALPRLWPASKPRNAASAESSGATP